MEKKSWVCTVIIQLALCFALYYAINFVRGGFRAPKEQTRLLKQIEKVMNTYKVGFVINISELGEDDPLLQNATQYFNPFEGSMVHYSLNNGMIQDPSEVQLKQLSRKLESSNSNWHIATGFHPLFCNQSWNQTQAKGNNVMLQMLMNHGVVFYSLTSQMFIKKV
ncbi:unnamed protein product [Lactuca virosa]|uniref:Uncharacterized protein n=1 Tax=Lactuca virosa TaxID=75947 RepID=A0AAU9MY48_9ASTR|nr:unnamed protein product [Lactuca virosa]